MSNVHPIRDEDIGLAQLVVELRKNQARSDLETAIYKEACLDLCNVIEYLISPFGQVEWEKKIDRVRAMCA